MPTPAHSLVLSHTVADDRNDFTGEVGVRLGIGPANIKVSWIGYRAHAGNTGLRTVTLYEWFSDTVVATATVDLTGAAVDSWVWVPITPVTLLANGYYTLLTNTTAYDGQFWLNNSAVTMQPSITNIYATYRSGGTLGVTGIDQTFVGLDLGWDDDITTGLVTWYKFDSAASPGLDSSGSGNTGILGGTPVPTVVSTPSQVGTGALNFASHGGKVTFTSVAGLNLATNGEITIAGWLKTTTPDVTLCSLRNSGSGNVVLDIVLGYNGVDGPGTGFPRYIIRDSAGAGLLSQTWSSAINNNAWHHIAFTRTAAHVVTLYIDGVSRATASDTTGAFTFNVAGSSVGWEAIANGRGIVGGLDDFRIYNRALTPGDIVALFEWRSPIVQVLNEGVHLGEAREAHIVSEVSSSSGFVSLLALWMGGAAVDSVIPPIVQVLNETVRVNESRLGLPFAEITRIINETVRVNESRLTFANITHAINEWVRVGEIRWAFTEIIRVINEAVRVSESRLRLAFTEITRVINEAVNLGEAREAHPHVEVIVPSVAPHYTKLGPGGYPIPDTSVPAEPPIIWVLNETVRVVEAKYNTVALIRGINETVRIAEAKLASISVSLIRVIAETVRVNEVRLGLAFAEITRIINETVRAVEVLVRSQLINRMVSETERLVEALLPVRVLTRFKAETVTVHEANLASRERARMVGESVYIASQQPVHRSAISLMIDEVVRLGEVLFPARAMARLVSEFENLVETMFGQRALTKAVAESERILERGSYNPLPVTNGLVVWLDAAALNLANDDPVTVWPNLGSGPNPNWVGSPPAKFKAGTLNDLGVVRFASLEAFLRSSFALTKDYTVIYISRMVGPNVGRVFSTIETTDHTFGYTTSGYDGFVDAVTVKSPVSYILPTPWRMYAVDAHSLPSYRSRFFINGVFNGNGINAAGGLGGGAWGLSGSRATLNDETSDAEVAEVLIYDHMLSNAERISVEHYLNSKWFPDAGGPLVVLGLTRLFSEVVSVTAEMMVSARDLVKSFAETVGIVGLSSLYARGQAITFNERESVAETSVHARGLARFRSEAVRSVESKLPARGRVQMVSEFLHLPEVFNFFASVPSLVCSAIKLYAVFAGDAAIAPVILASPLVIGPEIEGDTTEIMPVVDGVTGIETEIEGNIDIAPAVEGELEIEECC